MILGDIVDLGLKETIADTGKGLAWHIAPLTPTPDLINAGAFQWHWFKYACWADHDEAAILCTGAREEAIRYQLFAAMMSATEIAPVNTEYKSFVDVGSVAERASMRAAYHYMIHLPLLNKIAEHIEERIGTSYSLPVSCYATGAVYRAVVCQMLTDWRIVTITRHGNPYGTFDYSSTGTSEYKILIRKHN